MKRIYVAGPITSENPAKFMKNLRDGIIISKKLLIAGFAPFCPFFDFLYYIVSDSEITIDMLMKTDFSYLETCDAILVTGEWDESRGVNEEIEFANKKNIPIFYNLSELIAYFKD
jgi:hypothetical protein